MKTSIGGTAGSHRTDEREESRSKLGLFSKRKPTSKPTSKLRPKSKPNPKLRPKSKSEVEAEVVTSEETLEADAAPEEEDVEKDSFGAKKLPCGALLFTFDA